jgi:K+-sensing histidine kinase KdpD
MKEAIFSQFKSAARHYLMALLAVSIAFAATLAMSRFIQPGVSPLFLLAVMFSAWRGGLGAGLFATVLSAVASAFVFLPPYLSFEIDSDDWLQVAVFGFAACVIGSLSASRRRLLVNEKAARIEAERANAVKDEFLAAVSHELRTPLTTIKTVTRVMQRRETNEEERQEFLADIVSECDRQIDLVHNLLDLSVIRAGSLQLKPTRVDVREILLACRKIEHIEAAEHNHTLSIEVADNVDFVLADHNALRRALCTIIENAIKYTPDGGHIVLGARREDNNVIIEILDNGRGIREEDLPFIFDKFYRGQIKDDANEPEVPGIGLGLHLARELIKRMNGTIFAASSIGHGSSFSIHLPVWTEKISQIAEDALSDSKNIPIGKQPENLVEKEHTI